MQQRQKFKNSPGKAEIIISSEWQKPNSRNLNANDYD